MLQASSKYNMAIDKIDTMWSLMWGLIFGWFSLRIVSLLQFITSSLLKIIGLFEIIEKINSNAYRLKLPSCTHIAMYLM